jgi:hypothetical protein
LAVNTETPIAISTANGVTTVFPHAFTLLSAADLKVTGELAGVPLTYALGVDYTVSGVGTASGSVTFVLAPAAGTIVTRYRDSLIQRLTDYQNNGDLLARTLNQDLDRLWLALQEIFNGGKGVPTALRVPNSETIGTLPSATVRANQLLGFNGSGQPIMVPGQSGTATSLALDLATTDTASKAAGQIGLNTLLAYLPGTVGRWIKDATTGGNSTGMSLFGFLQRGIAAVARSAQDKARERYSFEDYGAVGDNTANDTAAIQAAIAAVAAAGGGVVHGTTGKIYRITATLLLASQVVIDLQGSTINQHTSNTPIFSAPATTIFRWGLRNGTIKFNTLQPSTNTFAIGIRMANGNFSYIFALEDLQIDGACDCIVGPPTTGSFVFVGRMTNVILTQWSGWAMNLDCESAIGANTNIRFLNVWALQTAGSVIPTSKGFRMNALSMGRWDSMFADFVPGPCFELTSCSGAVGLLTAESGAFAAGPASSQLSIFNFADSSFEVGSLKLIANTFTTTGSGEIYILRVSSSGSPQTVVINNFETVGNVYSGSNIYEVSPTANAVVVNHTARLDRAVNLADFTVVKRIQRWNGADRRITRGTTAQRPAPSADDLGMRYLDNTLAANGRPIFWNGTAWVDSTGTVV